MVRPEGSQNHNNAGAPRLKGQAIIAVSKDGNAVIQQFKLETGEILDYNQALDAIDNGEAEGLLSQWGRDRRIIRSHPDGRDDNDLDNLPEM